MQKGGCLLESVVIGLTGGIACGKSTVAQMLRKKGAVIIDADRLAKELMQADSPLWPELAAEFGPEIFRPDGVIDTKRLANLVFNDGKKLAKLNAIVHPRVLTSMAEKIEDFKQRAIWPAIVIDAPLLYEAGAEKLADFTWVVTAERDIQVKRLLARDKSSLEQAERRMAAQMPLAVKAARGDAVIDNSGSRRQTQRRVAELWNRHVAQR